MKQALVGIVLVAALVGCEATRRTSDSDSGPADGGRADALAQGDGARADAGPVGDAGEVDQGTRDAGPSTDAALAADAGPSLDAGSSPDAGPSPDASPMLDAGAAPDSGALPDLGTSVDAGTLADAGAAVDAGSDGGTSTDAGAALGVVTTLAGSDTVGTNDGLAAVATFASPTAIALDPRDQTLVVTDAPLTAGTGNRLRRVTKEGLVTTLWSGAPLNDPWGVAVAADGTIYVANRGNHVILRMVGTAQPQVLAGTAGMTGSTNANGAGARFNAPRGLALDTDGTLLVADAGNNLVRRVTPSGDVTTVAGVAGSQGYMDGVLATATLYAPYGVGVRAAGDVLFVGQDHCVRRITGGRVDALAGLCRNFSNNGTTDGASLSARFNWPRAVAFFPDGRVLVADSSNNLLRVISADLGTVSALAGTLSATGTPQAGFMDGAALGTARFNNPTGVVVDSMGVVYIADQGNHRIRVLR